MSPPESGCSTGLGNRLDHDCRVKAKNDVCASRLPQHGEETLRTTTADWDKIRSLLIEWYGSQHCLSTDRLSTMDDLYGHIMHVP